MFEQPVIDTLKAHVSGEIKLAPTPNPELGDYAFACFELAKAQKKNPAEVAKELAEKISKTELIEQVTVAGPYVNFKLNTNAAAQLLLERVEKEQTQYGSNQSGKGQHALIEHTSINPNASPHVGRARNALIGDCVARLLRFEGYETEVHYFVNDVGKQIALLVYACRDKDSVTFDELLQLYIDANAELEKNPELEKEIFALLHQFEQGDEAVQKRFRAIVDICVQGQAGILSELGINFDHFDYESGYIVNKRVDETLEKLKKTGKVFTDEDNREVLDLDGYNIPVKNPVFVLTRNDGTSLYSLRDIAYNLDKNEWAKGRNIVVLGEDQKTYMQQISAALDILGQPAPHAVHYSFIVLSTGKMSTRKGNLVLLKDFMDEAIKRAMEAMQRHFDKEKAEKLAKDVAYGAVKFAILRVSNERMVTFDWEHALSFEGETAAYCQYAHARIHSIFKKVETQDPKLPSTVQLSEAQEHALVLKLSMFPQVVSKTLESANPSTLTHYVFELAQLFSEFYHACPVASAEGPVKESRLALCNAVRYTLHNGLSLLGINVPEEM